MVWSPDRFDPVFASLLSTERLMPLGPGQPVASAHAALQALTVESAFAGHTLRDRQAALACLAGIWLYFDFLDESHALSQDLSTSEGSFWHAIMHRREPDAANSKYWWRRVGKHPGLETLRQQAKDQGFAFSTPEAFVDVCERVRGSGTSDEAQAQRVQLLEWQILFAYCFAKATASA